MKEYSVPFCVNREAVMENKQSSHLNTVCIGLEGFHRTSGDFICKEFCLVDCDSNYVYHKTIKTTNSIYEDFSESELAVAEFEIENYHGLSFHCGDIELSELLKQVYPLISDKKVIVFAPLHIEWMNSKFDKCEPINCEFFDLCYRRPIYPSRFGVCHYHQPTGGYADTCAHRVAQDLSTAFIRKSRIESIQLQNCTVNT